MSRLSPAFLVSLLLSVSVHAGELPPLPTTPVKPVADTYHGVTVTDPYRWLETDDAAVRQWTEAQNRHARASLDQFPALEALRRRVLTLHNASAPAYFSLQYRGGKLFALKSQAPKEQPYLITLRSTDDPKSEQVIFDPTVYDAKGRTTIDFFVPSDDGKFVVLSLSENGSEAGTVHVVETATGSKLADVVPRVTFATGGGSVAWDTGGGGFYYTRYPREGERAKEDLQVYQQVYYHRLGSSADDDRYEVGKEFPRIAETMLQVAPDGKHVLATVANGDGGEYAHYLRDLSGKWSPITQFADKVTAAAFGPGGTLFLLSTKGAPRGKLLRLRVDDPQLEKAKVIVPESEAALEGIDWAGVTYYVTFAVTPTRLYLLDMVGGPSRIRVFDHDGKPLGTVPLKPIATAGALVALAGDDVLFHSETYVDPPAWYHYDARTGKARRTALARTTPESFKDIQVVRETAVSKDGTKVPLTVLMKKGTKLDGTNPVLLTAYGGFGISQRPGFSAVRRAWLEQGGVYAVANIRGGGEFGEEWHTGGKLLKKQNCFDDFIACARHLIEKKVTNAGRLAIQGGSNGGLLMGAALTQHPELFRAVVSHVGIYDMLRFEQHPNGVFNVTEYGSVKDAEQFRALYAYSPYHRVKDAAPYPAVLLLTGANDGRVDPANSRKFAARLQAASTSGRPILLFVNFGAGHGAGTAMSEALAQAADVYAFLFQQLGVEYKPMP